MKIAIDGPAGAGKSTIARKLAQQLGFIYIDSGAMYRALTWQALQEGIKPEDSTALVELAQSLTIHFENNSIQHIFCNDIDVTTEIRTPQVTGAVSQVAAHPLVRQVMVKKQQELAQFHDIVMDGRDIGECVLPDADYKFFLTASIETRAERRIKELESQGYCFALNNIIEEIAARDRMDAAREVGALKILSDSIVIDTSNLTIDQVLAKIISIIGKD
ncbi:MAG: (d)CMP kinase [Syntrophomonadaceae bacterium]